MSNNILVDLKKVQWAKFFWENQDGAKKQGDHKPVPSVHCIMVSDILPAYHHYNFPRETELQRAKRLGILDVWYPVLILELSANHRLRYTGKKAKQLWKVWKAKIYANRTTTK